MLTYAMLTYAMLTYADVCCLKDNRVLEFLHFDGKKKYSFLKITK
jgi:hypothetical protein